jgi:hypothetical protein
LGADREKDGERRGMNHDTSPQHGLFKALEVEPHPTMEGTSEAKVAAKQAVVRTYGAILTLIGAFSALEPFIRSWVKGPAAAALVAVAGLILLFAAAVLISKLRVRLKKLNAHVLWNSAGWLVAFGLTGVIIVGGVFGLAGRALSAPSTSPTPAVTSTAKPKSITVRCSLSQRKLKPGMILQLTYHVFTSSAVRASLGVGVYDNQGNDHSNGRYDRNEYPLMAGDHSYSRQVAIPRNLASGRYEMDAEIWPPNHVGQNGFNDWTDAFCAYMTVP